MKDKEKRTRTEPDSGATQRSCHAVDDWVEHAGKNPDDLEDAEG